MLSANGFVLSCLFLNKDLKKVKGHNLYYNFSPASPYHHHQQQHHPYVRLIERKHSNTCCYINICFILLHFYYHYVLFSYLQILRSFVHGPVITAHTLAQQDWSEIDKF